MYLLVYTLPDKLRNTVFKENQSIPAAVPNEEKQIQFTPMGPPDGGADTRLPHGVEVSMGDLFLV